MKKLLVSLIVVLAISVPASARDFYLAGDVQNWATSTHDSFGIGNGTTININDGVTITMNREATYSSSYLGVWDDHGSAYLNISGSGRINFAAEMAIVWGDDYGNSGTERILSMSGTSYMNPAKLYLGCRASGVLNITDSAVIDIRTDGTLYPPGIEFGSLKYGYDFTATINQSGNSIIQSLASGMKMGNLNTAIYNMSGGQLILGGTITGAGADDAFNFSGGTITLLGGDYRSLIDENWFYGNAIATFDGQDTTIVVPEPATMMLLGLGGLLIKRKR